MIKQSVINIIDKKIAVDYSATGTDTIIFIHGSSMCSSTWSLQLSNTELQKKYQLVAIDLPGHGSSQWLNDAAEYSFQFMTNIIRHVIRKFCRSTFVLVGTSYGTNIIGEMTTPVPGCKGIMLISPCIVNDLFPPSEVITPGPYGHLIVAENPPADELKEYIRWGTSKEEVGNRYYDSYRNTDPSFRQGIGQVMMNSGWTDELDNIQKWNVPVCVVFGEEEKLIKTDYLNMYPPLWNGKVYRIKKAGHLLQEENPDDFNELLLSFATAVFK